MGRNFRSIFLWVPLQNSNFVRYLNIRTFRAKRFVFEISYKIGFLRKCTGFTHLLLARLPINMIKKGQVDCLNYSVFNEVKYIKQLFGLVL